MQYLILTEFTGPLVGYNVHFMHIGINMKSGKVHRVQLHI